MPGSRPRYPAEYRRQMVDLVRSGRSPDRLASEFEASAQSIRNWVRQADLDEGRRGDTAAERLELRRLRREVRRLREERAILAKGHGLVRSGDGPEGVFRFMRAYRAEFRVTTMARVLGVSTSGYYAWLNRPESAREKADRVLAERVRAIHERSGGTYGAPRIRAELADEGFPVSRKRVARLMQECALAGVSRRK